MESGSHIIVILSSRPPFNVNTDMERLMSIMNKDQHSRIGSGMKFHLQHSDDQEHVHMDLTERYCVQ